MKTTRRSTNGGRRGAALVITLIVMVLIAGMGAGLVQVQNALTRKQSTAIDTKRALYIAEAGISEGYHALAIGQSGNVGSPEKPAAFAGGLFWVEAEETADGRVVLSSTGLIGTGRFALSTVMEPTSSYLVPSGVFGLDEVYLRAGAVVDGWDPADGPYDPDLAAKGNGATVSSNGDLTLEGDVKLGQTVVYGDANPGPSGQVTIEPGATVTGTTSPLDKAVQLFALPPPTLPLFSIGSKLLTGEGQLLELKVEKTTVTLKGPLTLVVDTLELKDYGELLIDATGGPVVIYVKDELKSTDKSIVTHATGGTGEVAILVGDPEVEKPSTAKIELKAQGEFNGLLYAPNREIILEERLRVFGALVGERVELKEQARFTFMEGVATDLDVPGASGPPELLAWERVDLPDEPLVNSGLDAVATLILLGGESKPPYDSHDEVEVEFKYEDLSGKKHEEFVNARTIDWSKVKKVKSLKWKDRQTGKMKKVKNVEKLQQLLGGEEDD